MTKSSPQAFVKYDWNLSFDQTKEFFNETGVLVISSNELRSNLANLLFEIYGSDIVIPEGISFIVEHAFDGLPITSIKLPNSVTGIGEFAFRNTKLTEVDLSSVTEIYEYAFTETPITRIKLSPNLYDLDPGAFSDTKLQSVVVSSTHAPRTNQYYPPGYYIDEAFDKNTVLILDGIITRDIAKQLVGRSGSNLIIPEGVVSIEECAFEGMSIDTVILPNSLKTIGSYAFAETGLENVEIPENVIEVGSNAFPDTTNPEPALVNPVEMDGLQANSDQGTSEPVLPDLVTEFDDTQITSEPVLPEPVFEFYDPQISSGPVLPDLVSEYHDPLTGSEPIPFEGVLEPFDSLTNPNQVFGGTVSEFIEPDPFAISGSAGTVIEPIDGLQGSSTDGFSEFSEEQLQADLVNSMAAPSEVLA